MHETGFKGDFPAFLKFLRTDPRFYAKTPEELLMRAAWIAKRFDGKAAQYFGYLPRARFAIKPVPDDLAPFYTAGRGGPGVYLVNTYDLPSRPLYNLTALTLHESAPGHAFQMPIAMEHKDQPSFRQLTYISAYGEGWALYCERLGLEMGMYDTPYDRFGMLGYQIWRAARLVVDTGIHSQGWTREQALEYFRANTALPEHEIGTEMDRYIAWPAQALSYYLGERAILEARAQAERSLGRALQHPRLPRRRAGAGLRAAAGADGAHRALHRRGRPAARIPTWSSRGGWSYHSDPVMRLARRTTMKRTTWLVGIGAALAVLAGQAALADEQPAGKDDHLQCGCQDQGPDGR